MKLRKEKFVPAPPLVGIHPNPGPRPRKHLSEEKRWEIVFMWKRERRTPYKIAKTLQVSYNSAEVIKKYQETVHDPLHGEKTQVITCGDENSCSDGKEAQICPRNRAFPQQ